jgi:hypothetical protein
MILKHNPRVEIRPSTKEDYQAFYGFEAMPFTVRSLSFFLDGALKGLGGVRLERGVYIAFSDMKEDVKVSKATIYRCGLAVMGLIKEMGISVLAVAKNDQTAPAFLKRLGFTLADPEEGIYRHG